MWRRLVCYKSSGFGETFCFHLNVDTSENKDGNNRFHWNFAIFIPGYIASHPTARNPFGHCRKGHKPHKKGLIRNIWKKTLLRESLQGDVRHKLGVVPNEGHRTDVPCNLHNDTNVSPWPTPASNTGENLTWKTCCEQLGWVWFSTCTKRERLQNENVSQKLQRGIKLHYLYPSSFTFFCVYIATPKNLERCREAASQPPVVPCFQFPPFYPFFRTQYLVGPILVRTRFCESSCKQKVAFHVHPQSHSSY